MYICIYRFWIFCDLNWEFRFFVYMSSRSATYIVTYIFEFGLLFCCSSGIRRHRTWFLFLDSWYMCHPAVLYKSISKNVYLNLDVFPMCICVSLCLCVCVCVSVCLWIFQVNYKSRHSKYRSRKPNTSPGIRIQVQQIQTFTIKIQYTIYESHPTAHYTLHPTLYTLRATHYTLHTTK